MHLSRKICVKAFERTFNQKNLQANGQKYPTSFAGNHIRMLLRAWKFSHTITGENMEQMQGVLEQSFAFEEGEEYILKIAGE